MEPKRGDRISIDAKKVGQARRSGVVMAVNQGLSGVRFEVRWDDGTLTIIAPGAGVLLVEGKAPKGKAKTKAKTKTKVKAKIKVKAKVKATKAKKKTKRP